MRRIFHYNATCEMAVANNKHSYQPPSRLMRFEDDMADILLFLASADDVVLTPRLPEESFLRFWKNQGLEMPAFETIASFSARNDRELFTPASWGHSPAEDFLFSRILHKPDDHINTKEWPEEKRRFFSRISSVKFEQILQLSTLPELYKSTSTATMVTTAEELMQFIEKWEEKFVLKSLWSSSGRGVAIVREPQHLLPAFTWAKGRIRNDGCVVVEPFYQKMADFSFQFLLNQDNDVKYLGINHFSTSIEGKFDKEWLHQPQWFTDAERLLPDNWEQDVVAHISETIKSMNWHLHYTGIVGMDALIYQKNDGSMGVRPCVEINFRYNMGIINMSIRDLISPQAQGFWQIEQFDAGRWHSFYQEMMESHTPVFENGRLRSGFLPLTAPHPDKMYGAWGLLE